MRAMGVVKLLILSFFFFFFFTATEPPVEMEQYEAKQQEFDRREDREEEGESFAVIACVEDLSPAQRKEIRIPQVAVTKNYRRSLGRKQTTMS